MIKTVMSAAIAFALLSGCASVPPLEAPPASAFAPLEPPRRVFASANSVIDYFLEQTNIGDAEVTREIGRDPTGLGSRLALVTTSGYEDDAVSGEQWRITLTGTDVGLRVLDAGIRYNCRRGANPGWSRTPCP